MDSMDGATLMDWTGEEDSKYVLKLFVAGSSSGSVRAINNLKIILDEHLKDQYELDIIDVHQQPLIAISEDVAAVPMLVKKHPFPVRKMIGDMSDTARVMRGLGIK
jgi:circadian clock protein KaiB